MPFGEFLVKYSADHRQQGIDWGSVFNRTYSGRRTGYPGTRFCPQGRERFPARRFLRWRLPSRNGDGATQQIRHRYAVGRCLLLCIGCTAFGRFRRVALGPGVHGIGAERRVYSSVSFRSSKSVPRTCSVPSFPSLLRVFPGFPLMLAESPLPLSFLFTLAVFLQRISCCTHCIIGALSLQEPCLPGRRLQHQDSQGIFAP